VGGGFWTFGRYTEGEAAVGVHVDVALGVADDVVVAEASAWAAEALVPMGCEAAVELGGLEIEEGMGSRVLPDVW
jgi:hypothetical protein